MSGGRPGWTFPERTRHLPAASEVVGPLDGVDLDGPGGSLNALQLARITAVAANGGYLVEPHLVTRIVEPGGARGRARFRAGRASSRRETAAAISQDPRGRRRARHRREGGGPGFRGRRQDRHRAEGRGRGIPGRPPRPELRRLRSRGNPPLRRGRRGRGAAGQVLRGRSRGPALLPRHGAGARDPPGRAPRAARARVHPCRRGPARDRSAVPRGHRARGGRLSAPRRRPNRSGRRACSASRRARPSRFSPRRRPRPPAGQRLRRRVRTPRPARPLRAGAVHTLFLADSAEAPARAAGRPAEETPPPPSAP